MDDTKKQDVINFLKIVITDSVSVILGTLDGVHYPDDIEGDFVLSVDGDEIQGDLQDLFFDRAQEDGVYD